MSNWRKCGNTVKEESRVLPAPRAGISLGSINLALERRLWGEWLDRTWLFCLSLRSCSGQQGKGGGSPHPIWSPWPVLISRHEGGLSGRKLYMSCPGSMRGSWDLHGVPAHRPESVHLPLCGTESWPLVIQTKAAKRHLGHFSICGTHFIS